ncbi:bifunctional oligoribonuclease/PAP phosphatase NrnA [Aliifodinibius sp. S!AR15-10]|uniref:DHH family phosphoesterase n=1 Tax=Aliifodinibius sp. S!AR15-10 TaxID=2950437 RepID=UPI00285B5EB0|nr:bifunctional oligoribonuclease/PAP phosphatase NrnA [Aliifodinibius sp. S!AR15-10]MDR8394162.1 bifunctional oligoribonuclease/PAP phosphatase NrnA [Aliifodinibius sp. S!AR15-10]
MFKKLIKRLQEHQTVGVFSHIRPDGDCIGAQIAMCLWLENNGIKAYAFNDDPVPMNLEWLTEYYPVQEPDEKELKECDAFVLVDGNSPPRFGTYSDYIQDDPKPTYMIDHHPDPNDGFDMSISVEEASSTCELIFHVFLQHDINQLDSRAAKALYTGILTDTGSLQYDSVTPETLNICSELLRLGEFRPNEVAEKVFSHKTLNQLRLLGMAISTIELYEDNQIAIMCVTKEMLEKTNTTNDDTEGFVAYPLSVADIKAAVLFKALGDGVKMSLRSKSNEVDVNKWAREIGGGGHKKASGAWHPGPLEKTIEEVVEIGSKQLVSIDKS